MLAKRFIIGWKLSWCLHGQWLCKVGNVTKPWSPTRWTPMVHNRCFRAKCGIGLQYRPSITPLYSPRYVSPPTTFWSHMFKELPQLVHQSICLPTSRWSCQAGKWGSNCCLPVGLHHNHLLNAQTPNWMIQLHRSPHTNISIITQFP